MIQMRRQDRQLHPDESLSVSSESGKSCLKNSA